MMIEGEFTDAGKSVKRPYRVDKSSPQPVLHGFYRAKEIHASRSNAYVRR